MIQVPQETYAICGTTLTMRGVLQSGRHSRRGGRILDAAGSDVPDAGGDKSFAGPTVASAGRPRALGPHAADARSSCQRHACSRASLTTIACWTPLPPIGTHCSKWRRNWVRLGKQLGSDSRVNCNHSIGTSGRMSDLRPTIRTSGTGRTPVAGCGIRSLRCPAGSAIMTSAWSAPRGIEIALSRSTSSMSSVRQSFPELAAVHHEFEQHRKTAQHLLTQMQSAHQKANTDGVMRARQVLGRIAAKVRKSNEKRGTRSKKGR